MTAPPLPLPLQSSPSSAAHLSVRHHMKDYGTFLLLVLISQSVWPIDVWVWSNDEVALHYNILQTNDDHPCGSVSRIEISAFPDANTASEIEMEKVIEYSEDGIINQWTIPIDKYVMAIEGEYIYIPYKEGALRLAKGGNFSITSKPNYESEWINQCPTVAMEQFPDSVYVRCFGYKDLRTNKYRQIAYEGPCT